MTFESVLILPKCLHKLSRTIKNSLNFDQSSNQHLYLIPRQSNPEDTFTDTWMGL